MVNAAILIYHPLIGTKKITAQSVSIQGNKNNEIKPPANGTDIAIINTLSQNNIKYTLNNVQLVDSSDTVIQIHGVNYSITGSLTYLDILKLYKAKYDEAATTNGVSIKLYIYYKNYQGTATVVPDYDETVGTGVACVLDTFTFNIDVNDVKDGKLPTLNLTFTETA